MNRRLDPPWAAAHRRALEQGDAGYTDPQTGYFVFTEIAHKKRGSCCGSKCRHCPFDHEAVPPHRR